MSGRPHSPGVAGGATLPGRYRTSGLLAAMAVAALAAGAGAQSTSTARDAATDTVRVPVSGRVTQEDGRPVAAAVVRLLGVGDSAVTDDEGRFTLRGAPPGAYLMSARRLGFRAERFALSLRVGEARELTILTSRTIPLLPTVTTTAEERAAYRRVGFDQRMRAGQGQFLTYDQIVRRQATTFTQLLQNMRGLRLWQNQHQFGTSVEETRGAGSCVSYMVDGMPQDQLMDIDPTSHMSIGPESPDNMFDPSDIGALEVYTSAERPPGLGPLIERPIPGAGDPVPRVAITPQCTVVVIWTRTRLGLRPDAKPQPKDRSHAGDVIRGLAALPPNPACAARAARSAIDTADLVVYATVEGAPPRAMPDTAWSRYKGRVLSALDQSATLPTEMVLPSFGLPLASHGQKADAAPSLSTTVEFTLDERGSLVRADVAASSLSGAADTSVLAIVQGAARARTLPALPVPHAGDSAVLRLAVTSTEPGSGQPLAVLGLLEVPVWRLDAKARPAGDAALDAPGAAASRADSVAATFVVDTAGRAALSTLRIHGAARADTGRSFRDARARILTMLPERRFEPARIGACAVPQLLTQSFAVPGGGAPH